MSSKSCTTHAVTYCFEFMDRSLEKGHSIDAIYIDFAKAFDSVPHVRLLTKLDLYGIVGN